MKRIYYILLQHNRFSKDPFLKSLPQINYIWFCKHFIPFELQYATNATAVFVHSTPLLHVIRGKRNYTNAQNDH